MELERPFSTIRPGGLPPLEVGEAMILADRMTVIGGAAAWIRWGAPPSGCHRFPHVRRTWGTCVLHAYCRAEYVRRATLGRRLGSNAPMWFDVACR